MTVIFNLPSVRIPTYAVLMRESVGTGGEAGRYERRPERGALTGAGNMGRGIGGEVVQRLTSSIGEDLLRFSMHGGRSDANGDFGNAGWLGWSDSRRCRCRGRSASRCGC